MSKKIFSTHHEKTCEFVLGAHNSKQFPNTNFPEFAFIGSSNVGKSSLVNSITMQKIAIVSNTPGRTRQLNFFLLSDSVMIVDMPGYGFAKAPEKNVENWQKTSFEYFATRKQLKRVFMLIDPEKGLKKPDYEIANILNSVAINFQIVFTKIDKIDKFKLDIAQEKIKLETKGWPALYPEFLFTSSKKNIGLNDIKKEIINVIATCK